MIATKVSASASRPPLCCTCTTRGTVIRGCSKPWARAHGKALRFCLSDLVRMKGVLHAPLPHQITAVYEAMLPRQPLRFLLADDPGAGKTIMAGLLMKELIARGDLHRAWSFAPAVSPSSGRTSFIAVSTYRSKSSPMTS
jgi:hypothetical protein